MRSIGFVGLGLMGEPMARRFLEAGFPVRVTNRTRSKAGDLTKNGAIWCNTPRAVADGLSVVHSMVSTPEALEAVSLGPDGILAGLRARGVHVDHSTVSPSITGKLSAAYRAADKFFLHAPVLGSVPQVREGSLLLFVGGEEAGYALCRETIGLLGQKIWRFAQVEQATNMKLLCNSFIGGMIVVLSQAIVLAKHLGVDPSVLLEIIGQSQLNAPMYQGKGKAMIEGNVAPRFYVEHLLKDVRLVLAVARDAGVPVPGLEAVEDLFVKAVDAGLAREDYSAVAKMLEPNAERRS